jgi:hypothetical protein
LFVEPSKELIRNQKIMNPQIDEDMRLVECSVGAAPTVTKDLVCCQLSPANLVPMSVSIEAIPRW